MLKSYEALYDHGQIRWLETPPDVALARVIVTVLAEPAAAQATLPICTEESVDALLSRTAGAWGRRSPQELAALLSAQREADWGRDDPQRLDTPP